jgi:Glycine zipper
MGLRGSRMRGLRAAGWVVLVALCAGCASGPRATGTVVGASVGAASGALIGGGFGKGSGNAALIGAGLGALLGMLMGDLVQQQQTDRPPSTPRSPTPTSSPSTTGGATKGEFINGTTWLVHVYIDPSDPENPEKATPILLRPVERVPWELDAGRYRIVARAYTGAQDGERLVGRFDRTIQIDIRRAGWFLEFGEEDFR